MSHDVEIHNALQLILKRDVEITSSRPVGGGSISRAYAVKTRTGEFFLKANNEAQATTMFEAEMDGLQTLKEFSQFAIPAVLGITQHNGVAYLLMELIDSASKNVNYWQELGQNLAALHRVQEDSFGYHQANFIGSLPQTNQRYQDWGEFFVNERMHPMIRLAHDRGLVDASFVIKFDAALTAIIKEMPVEQPSLVHGDLWSGNLMVDASGRATIIDPAVYFGHREMDLSFSEMFGGFSGEFYSAYKEAYPMEPGFSQRVELYNLYPYLVHLNLFGRSYFAPIDATIRRFT